MVLKNEVAAFRRSERRKDSPVLQSRSRAYFVCGFFELWSWAYSVVWLSAAIPRANWGIPLQRVNLTAGDDPHKGSTSAKLQISGYTEKSQILTYCAVKPKTRATTKDSFYRSVCPMCTSCIHSGIVSQTGQTVWMQWSWPCLWDARIYLAYQISRLNTLIWNL